MAEDEIDLIRKLDKQYQKWGLTISNDTIKYMVVGDPSKDLFLQRGVINRIRLVTNILV